MVSFMPLMDLAAVPKIDMTRSATTNISSDHQVKRQRLDTDRELTPASSVTNNVTSGTPPSVPLPLPSPSSSEQYEALLLHHQDHHPLDDAGQLPSLKQDCWPSPQHNHHHQHLNHPPSSLSTSSSSNSSTSSTPPTPLTPSFPSTAPPAAAPAPQGLQHVHLNNHLPPPSHNPQQSSSTSPALSSPPSSTLPYSQAHQSSSSSTLSSSSTSYLTPTAASPNLPSSTSSDPLHHHHHSSIHHHNPLSGTPHQQHQPPPDSSTNGSSTPVAVNNSSSSSTPSSSSSSSSTSNQHWLNSILPVADNNNDLTANNNNNTHGPDLCVKSEISTPAESEANFSANNFSQYILPDKSLSGDLSASYLQQLQSSDLRNTMQTYSGQSYMQPATGFYNTMPNAQYASYGADYLLGTTRTLSNQNKANNNNNNNNSVGSSAALGSSCLSAPGSSAYLSNYGGFTANTAGGAQSCQNTYYGTSYNTFGAATNAQNYATQQGLDSYYYANSPAAAAAAGYYYQGYPYMGTTAVTNNSPAASTVAAQAAAVAANTAANSSVNLTLPNTAAGGTYQVSMPSNPIIDENGSFQNMDSPPSPLKDSNRSRTARTRRGQSPSDQENKVDRVYIWELDKTTIIFHSLLTGDFACRFGKNANECMRLGYMMERLVFDLADNHFFFNDVQECDQVHIDDVASDDNGQDLSTYNFATDGFSAASSATNMCLGGGVRGGVDWMRKLAFRYRKIKEIYNGYRNNLGGLLNAETREKWLQLRQELEGCTDNWLSEALNCLNYINSRPNYVNVLVTKTQLVPSLCIVLLFGLGGVFPIENIYSSNKVGKESCFERIASRFGRKPVYVVVGDGRASVENQNEAIAAKQLEFPFWPIQSHADFVNLYKALSLCGI